MGLADTVSKKGEAGVDQGGHLVLGNFHLVQGGAVLLAHLDKVVLQLTHHGVRGDLHKVHHAPGHLVVLVHPQQIASQAAAVGFILRLVIVPVVHIKPGIHAVQNGFVLLMRPHAVLADAMAGHIMTVHGVVLRHMHDLFPVTDHFQGSVGGEIVCFQGQGLDRLLVLTVPIDAPKGRRGGYRQDQHTGHQADGQSISLLHPQFLLHCVTGPSRSVLPAHRPETGFVDCCYYTVHL